VVQPPRGPRIERAGTIALKSAQARQGRIAFRCDRLHPHHEHLGEAIEKQKASIAETAELNEDAERVSSTPGWAAYKFLVLTAKASRSAEALRRDNKKIDVGLRGWLVECPLCVLRYLCELCD